MFNIVELKPYFWEGDEIAAWANAVQEGEDDETFLLQLHSLIQQLHILK